MSAPSALEPYEPFAEGRSRCGTPARDGSVDDLASPRDEAGLVGFSGMVSAAQDSAPGPEADPEADV
eukprot:911473-Prymnesium_polylepis.1